MSLLGNRDAGSGSTAPSQYGGTRSVITLAAARSFCLTAILCAGTQNVQTLHACGLPSPPAWSYVSLAYAFVPSLCVAFVCCQHKIQHQATSRSLQGCSRDQSGDRRPVAAARQLERRRGGLARPQHARHRARPQPHRCGRCPSVLFCLCTSDSTRTIHPWLDYAWI